MGVRSRRALLFAAIHAWFVSGCSLLSLDELTEGGAGGAAGSPATVSASSSAPGAGGDAASGSSQSTGGGSVTSSSRGGSGGGGPEGLIGHWPLDDGSGLIASDQSGSALDGFLVDGPTWTTGMFGGALAFVGDTGRMDVPALTGAAFPTAGTLSIWFNGAFVDGAETASRGIFDNYDSSRAHLFIRRTNENPEKEIEVAMQPPYDQYVFVVVIPVATATWHHIVVVWDCDQDTVIVHFDGTAYPGTIADPAFVPDQQNFRFGYVFDGSIDEIRLYDRPLTNDEVARL